MENRSQPFGYRGPLAIHAGLGWDPAAEHNPVLLDAWRAWNPSGSVGPIDKRLAWFEFGAIIATAELADCHPAVGCCEPWGEPAGIHHLVLNNVRPLDTPIPCRGALGLWRPAPDILEKIR